MEKVKKKNSEEIRILFIEDNNDDYALTEHSLKKNMKQAVTFERASNWLEGLTSLRNNTFDVVLLDYFLPDRNGLEIMKLLRKENINVPVIMLTGAGDENVAIDAMKEGVRDYIIKENLNTEKLSESINKVVNLTCFLKQSNNSFAELGGFSKKRDAFTIIGTLLSVSCNGINKTNPSHIPHFFRPFMPLNEKQLFKCSINDLFSLFNATNAPNAGPNAPINKVKKKTV